MLGNYVPHIGILFSKWKSRDLIASGKLAVKINRFGTFEFVDPNKKLVEDQIENILD
jgi:hypothetical protein